MAKNPKAMFGAVAAGLMLNAQVMANDLCDKLEVYDGRLYLTCEFAEALDGQEFCSATDAPAANLAARKNQLAVALVESLNHRAIAHSDCEFQMGRLLLSKGQNPERILGNDWDDDRSCILIQKRNECRAVLEESNSELAKVDRNRVDLADLSAQ